MNMNLSMINTNTMEGRLLMAAMAIITTESRTDKTPDDVLQSANELQEYMYKDAGPIPEAEQEPTFSQALRRLLNKYNKELPGNTPDIVLCSFLETCLAGYNEAINKRDAFFKFKPWGENPEVKKEYSLSEAMQSEERLNLTTKGTWIKAADIYDDNGKLIEENKVIEAGGAVAIPSDAAIKPLNDITNR